VPQVREPSLQANLGKQVPPSTNKPSSLALVSPTEPPAQDHASPVRRRNVLHDEPRSIDLGRLFLSLQDQLAAKFATSRDFVLHKATKGTAAELNWLALLNAYLPQRYTADSAFIVDHRGQLSEQIDVVIYDRQYSPLIFRQEGVLYIPAESVYAVFDVKHRLFHPELEAAAEKAESVRRLKRTNAVIHHAGGKYEHPRPLFPILAGVLCIDTVWSEGFGDFFTRLLNQLKPDQMLDLGCAVQEGAFETSHTERRVRVETTGREHALIFFLIRLLNRLQKMGTVPAIDLMKYSSRMTTRTVDALNASPRWRKCSVSS
jgi:hypothetical protein